MQAPTLRRDAETRPPLSLEPSPSPAEFFRFNLGQYHRVADSGVLDDERVELLDGWLLAKEANTPQHALATHAGFKALFRAVPWGWDVLCQLPITLRNSEPEPDAVVIRGRREDYPDRHPGPTEVAVVVEVADSSLERDSTLKLRLYAEAGIPTYWLVNLLDRQVEVYTQPSLQPEPRYLQREVSRPGDALVLTLDGREAARIPAAELLPGG